jgi:hypothetical protein
MRYQPGALVSRPVRGYVRRRCGRSSLAALCTVVVALLLAFAGCANAGTGYLPTVPASQATNQQGTGGSTAQATATSGNSYVEVADLGSFRHQLSLAFSSDNWSEASQFLSPEFSFQGANSGGNRMIMPDSEIDFSALYKSQAHWSQSSGRQVTIHFCDAGITPLDQQMGFDGGGGSFLLVGIDRWQGFWLVFWAFQDPNGGGDACATS